MKYSAKALGPYADNRGMKYCLSLTCALLLFGSSHVLCAESVNRERLWLPPAAVHLMPALEEAARRALAHPDCTQVLYGRLNEYRTEHNEPAMTILCQIDARTTFNLVFRVDELIIEDSDGSDLVFTTDNAESNLETLRRALMANPDVAPQASNQDTNEQGNPDENEGENQRSTVTTDPRSLELGLDELLRRPPPQTNDAPEIF